MKVKSLARPALLFLCVTALAGCGPFNDTSPPAIESVMPPVGSSGILVDQTLTITFDEDIDAESLHARLWKEAAEIQLGQASGTRSVLIKPLRPLDYGTAYKFVVDGGYSDLSGNASAEGYELNFSTSAKNTGFIKGSVIVDSFIKRVWDDVGFSPQQTLRDNGMTFARVGVTTLSVQELSDTSPGSWSEAATPWQDDFWSSREMAGQILEEARTAGCGLDVFLFLSDKAAFAGQQELPAAWSGKTKSQIEAAVRQSANETASYFSSTLGLPIDVYEIGNEIEFGILGYTAGSSAIPIPSGTDILRDIGWMESNVWDIEADLLKAAIRGIRDSGSSAKIGLHIAGLGYSTDNDFAYRFFKYMKDEGVDYDIAELSFPYMFGGSAVPQPYFREAEFARILDRLKGLGKEVYIAEFAYPAHPDGIAHSPSDLYPLTEQGQCDFIEDFMKVVQSHADGAFYFYPDYYPDQAVYGGGTIGLQSSGLFDDAYEANAGLAEFH